VGPAPLPSVVLSPPSLTPPGSVSVTLTDQHAAGQLVPGASYQVTVTVAGGGNTRTRTLQLIVGGQRVYLPLLRR